MGYTLCMVKDCSNLTNENYSEYGTFCFQHSNLTYEPQNFSKQKVFDKLTSVSISLGDLKKPFSSVSIFESSQKYRKVKSQEKKIPVILDSSKIKNTSYEQMSCCVCDEKDLINNKMNCGHLVCEECLDHIRSMKCPLCKCIMEGNLINDDIITEIESRYREDIEERGAEDETMAYLASIGYNPNELY